MPASPSSSAQAARTRLADKLRELRTDVQISGVAFARAAGWADSSMVSMIERGRRTISPDHVRLWCRICGASELRTEELLAEQASVAGTWVTYQQLNRGGLKSAQQSVRDMFENLTQYRAYQIKVIPGLLQTEAYTTAALTMIRREQGVEVNDVPAAVAERMDRRRVLLRPEARWVFVLEEPVLRYRPYQVEVHIEQLQHLLNVMHWPSVSLGIIPMDTYRSSMSPDESFNIIDQRLVSVELVSGYLSVTDPAEVEMYVRAWQRLFALAVHGDAAAGLIRDAIDKLT
ncbi:helix-turn-helix protein [Haloactinopolyspora alba]|uniref:Helix-turn-helix protein n=1 Tax=Haloactinopolyspora alba TaxID=648780 RepID=A0A2P8D740_9ACTN|nr:helix-turn-helix transcriptional regulator [Haloactinopolyspora alba]PSK93022.1 helix-turn-helix protein [Haloactinopolyspora alba]